MIKAAGGRAGKDVDITRSFNAFGYQEDGTRSSEEVSDSPSQDMLEGPYVFSINGLTDRGRDRYGASRK